MIKFRRRLTFKHRVTRARRRHKAMVTVLAASSAASCIAAGCIEMANIAAAYTDPLSKAIALSFAKVQVLAAACNAYKSAASIPFVRPPL